LFTGGESVESLVIRVERRASKPEKFLNFDLKYMDILSTLDSQL
jgi:hypothetical protein